MTGNASESDHALREDRDGVVTITFNRPEKLNAISDEILETLTKALEDLIARDDLQVLLIKAKGRYFSAGLDIHGGQSDRREGTPTNPQLTPDFGDDPMRARYWYRGYWRGPTVKTVAEMFEFVEKPVIFAVHAPCLGGAMEMALSADFRLAGASASFGLPEVQLGVLPGSGGMSRLTRLVGPAWAKWFGLANQRVTAERALMMGLVQDVYSDDEFDAKVWEFATHMVSMPRQLFAMGKLSIELCADLDRQQSRNVEVIANGALFTGAEYPKILKQFADKQAAKREARGQ